MKKQRFLIQAANAYINKYDIDLEVRFDIITVIFFGLFKGGADGSGVDDDIFGFLPDERQFFPVGISFDTATLAALGRPARAQERNKSQVVRLLVKQAAKGQNQEVKNG